MYERVTLIFGLRPSVLIFCQPGPETTSKRSSFKVIFIEIKKENMILTDLQKAFQDCARTDNSFIALTCMFFFSITTASTIPIFILYVCFGK